MNWYIAKIVYEIICGDGGHCPQFDEQLRLVSAENATEAFQLANEMGVAEAMSFENEKKQLVQWKFIAVPELLLLQTQIHGAELFSRIREVDDVPQYKEIIYSRANSLKQNQQPCPEYHFLT